MTFLKSKEDEVSSVLRHERTKRKRIKFYLALQVRFTKTRVDQVEVAEPHFNGRCYIVLKHEDVEHAPRESITKMINSFTEYQREESNWGLDKALVVSIHIVQYNAMKGSSYLPLPATLAKKSHRKCDEYRPKMLHVVGISRSLSGNEESAASHKICRSYGQVRLH